MVYNVKCLHYVDGETETRIYSHPVYTGGKQEEEKKKLNKEPDIERSIRNSQNRTIQSIYSVSKSNKWDWFITLTLDAKQVDRYDYVECSKKVSQWFQNLHKRKCPDMKYLIVPELHKDGAYHFHGLLSHCPELQMQFSGHFTKEGEPIYNITDYGLGWTTATEVQNNQAVAKYITKYITKELCTSTSGKKRFWCSRNVQKPIEQLYFLDGSNIDLLRYEMQEDHEHFKRVSYDICLSKASIEYYQNHGLTLILEETE